MLVSYGYPAGGLVMTGGGVAVVVMAGGGGVFVPPPAAMFGGAIVAAPPVASGAPPALFEPERCGVLPPLPIATTEPPLAVVTEGAGCECDEESLPLHPSVTDA
jgi:hypothetical protein